MSRHRPPVAVVGAGLAGLVAARMLHRRGFRWWSTRQAGMSRGWPGAFATPDGFTHDFGAHFITNRLAAALGIGRYCRDVRRYGEAVLLRGKAYSYPFGLLRTPRFLLGALAGRVRQRGERRPAPPPNGIAGSMEPGWQRRSQFLWSSHGREHRPRLGSSVIPPAGRSRHGARARAQAGQPAHRPRSGQRVFAGEA